MQKTIVVSVLVFVLTASSLKALTLETLPHTYGETTLVMEFDNNPLHISIVNGDLVTVRKLIGMGADVNQKWNGKTPAMYAARHNRVEILKVLIANGANLKSRCDKGKTASYYAKLSGAKDAEALIIQSLAT